MGSMRTALLMCTALAALATASAYNCSLLSPDPDEVLAFQNLIQAFDAASSIDVNPAVASSSQRTAAFANGPALVHVYVHVISKDGTRQGGNVLHAHVDSQIYQLNKVFRPLGFRFVLAGMSRTVNPQWWTVSPDDLATQQAMKSALRKGSMDDWNVYIAAPPGLTSYTIYPQANTPLWADGTVLYYGNLRGGYVQGENSGKVLAHEAGHWLGLLHPWNNGCNAPGDYNGDTAYMAAPLSDCKIVDSCTGKPGKDPIHNMMGYTPDSCRTGFTPQQIRRMQATWAAIRAGK